MCCSEKGIRKDACWALSNVTAGSQSQIQAVIEANIIPSLIHILSEAEAGTKKEAAWAISNVARYGSPEQIHYVVDQGCIRPLCDLLTAKDAQVVELALETLESILEAGVQRGCDSQYANEIGQAEGLDKIWRLQTHKNSGICQKAVMIQETYFSSSDKDDKDDEDEDKADEDGGGGGGGLDMAGPASSFNFGALSVGLQHSSDKGSTSWTKMQRGRSPFLLIIVIITMAISKTVENLSDTVLLFIYLEFI